MESSEERVVLDDGIGHRILTPSYPAYGKTCKDSGWTNHFAKACKNPGDFCERKENPGQETKRLLWTEGPGQEPERLLRVMDAQIPTVDGQRRYPEDE